MSLQSNSGGRLLERSWFALMPVLFLVVGCSGTSEVSTLDVLEKPNERVEQSQLQLNQAEVPGSASKDPSHDKSEASLLESTNSAASELVGMRTYTGWIDMVANRIDGVLIIDYPCVYLLEEERIAGLLGHEDENAPPRQRALLRLVRDWTSYDPEASSLISAGEGPMFTGDRIYTSGVPFPPEDYLDQCTRDYDIYTQYLLFCKFHACRFEREANPARLLAQREAGQ